MKKARRWLDVFGPATLDDLQWWTGWNKTQTRTALAGIDTVDVELTCGDGIMLAGAEFVDAAAGVLVAAESVESVEHPATSAIAAAEAASAAKEVRIRDRSRRT